VVDNSTVASGVAYALGLIRSRYEGNSNPDDDMYFHNVDHTEGVVRRTQLLLRTMGASPQEHDAGVVGAAFHDVVQGWEVNNAPDGKVLRKRFVERNETDSAAEAVAWMRKTGGFSDEQCDLVTRAIMGTVPAWDVENKTVSQPRVPPDAPPAVRAVALADLGIPGMDGGPEFVETGDGLFREENLDMGRALRACKSRSDLAADVLEGYKARIIGWCRGQASYARGRRARLPIELGDLSGSVRSAVEALFSKFDESIAAAEEVIRVRDAMTPWEVLRATGYTIPS
jgi:hypothetical protein